MVKLYEDNKKICELIKAARRNSNRTQQTQGQFNVNQHTLAVKLYFQS